MREYQVLGPLEVIRDGRPIDLGSPKQQLVLAALLLAHGAVVSVERLIDTVWPNDPPAAATTSLQAYISNLRRAIRGDDVTARSPIQRVGSGYRLALGEDTLDVVEFVELARAARIAREESRWNDALTAAESALARWRGDLLGAESFDVDWVAAEAASLAESRIALREIRITALLANGDTGGALSDIAALRVADPLRDRGVWLHMVALYRAGRATEALAVYTDHVRALGDELGLDPGTELTELHGAVLRHDPIIAAWPRPPHWSGAREVSVPARADADTGSGAAQPDADPSPEVPLIGRTAEVQRARAVLVGSRGATRWLLLGGPAGIGKTRLAEEVAGLAAEAGSRVVWVRCPDTEGVPAWWPLRQLCRALGVDPEAVLSIPPGVDADRARFAVYERVQAMLAEAASVGELTVIVDDAQWADPMTLGTLTFLTTVLRDLPICVVVTARDGEGSPDLRRFRAALARVGGVGIELPTLARAEIAQLVREVAAEELTDTELDTLVHRTGGNPLFVTEFSRLPADARRDETVPAAIRSVLDRRLASLDPAVLDVLGYAAVLGEEIDVALLATVMDRAVGEIADRIDEAVDDRILAVADGGTTRFAHALLREQALAGIRPLRRARIHLACAAVLAGHQRPGAAARRAGHLLEAMPVAEVGEVVAACRAAADEATSHTDSESASHWLGAALRTHESAGLGDLAERDEILIDLIAAQSRAGHVETVLATVAERLVQAISDHATATVGRLASALIRAGGSWPWVGPNVDNQALQAILDDAEVAVAADPAASARVLAASAIGQCYHHDASIPAGLLGRAEEIAERVGIDALTVDVLMARLITYSGVADYARSSIDLAARLRAIPHADAEIDDVIIDTALTMATMTLGDVATTSDLVRRAIAGSERLKLPILRAQLRWMEASLAVWRGDFATAKAHFQTAVTVHQMTELYVAGTGTIAMLALAAERGVLDELVDTQGLSPVEWARSLIQDFTADQVSILLAAGVAMIAGSDGDRDLAQAMIVSWIDDDRPMIWTSLCQAVLLAHVVVDLELDCYAAIFVDYLMPYRDGIATLGQLGCIGPVGLAVARLCFLLGRDEEGAAALDAAQHVSTVGAGVPSMLRCRLLRVQRLPARSRNRDEIEDIAARARDIGLDDLVTATARLLEQ